MGKVTNSGKRSDQELLLPLSMEWVYAYIDKKTGEAGYIGRAKNAKRLVRRMKEHQSDEWFGKGKWNIYFYPCINRWESEDMETILINKHNPRYNKDKKGWGRPYFGGPCDISQMMFGIDEENNRAVIPEMLYILIRHKEWRLKQEMIKDGWEILKNDTTETDARQYINMFDAMGGNL